MHEQLPIVRLHLWLEDNKRMFFGVGRVMLLDRIEEHGSIKKAAESMGMSYRAAWGKIKASEKALGVSLVENSGQKRDGCRLTRDGMLLRDTFVRWFKEVEQEALARARTLFPWPVKSFADAQAEQDSASRSRVRKNAQKPENPFKN